MQFYKIEVTCLPEAWEEGLSRQEVLKRLSTRAEEFSSVMREGVFYFLSSYEYGCLNAGLITEENRLCREELQKFVDAVRPEAMDIKAAEVTFRQFSCLLRSASRFNLIRDEDDVLQKFGLDVMEGYECRGLEISDALLPDADRKTILSEAKRYPAAESFVPELERIFLGAKTKQLPGHPVHYSLCTDDKELSSVLCRLLLQALHCEGRISGTRYNSVHVYADRDLAPYVCENIYRCCTGSALLVHYHDSDEAQGNYAGAGTQMLEMLCNMARKYRNEVLTVFCLPRESTRIKQLLQDSLGSLTLVEFRESFLQDEDAKAILRSFAKQSGLRADKWLIDTVVPGREYLTPELRELYQAWYDRKLKNSVYPQYKAFQPSAGLAVKSGPKGDAYAELQQMVGLTEAKTVMQQALNYYKMQKILASKGLQQSRPAMHMVFTGNPGTAKTTAARLFARIMQENGLLSKGHLVEVGRGDLVGKYVGWTAKTVQRKFRDALGGVLFIDEAYSLLDEHSGSFGDEAINTIVQEMENHRDELVVIFAGYPEPMERFLRRNPGLRSRIAFHVPFADYDTDELCQIAQQMTKKTGLHLTDGALERLKPVFTAARATPDFGNGRYVRNVLEQAKMKQANRLLRMDFDELTADVLTTLSADDIAAPEPQAQSRVCRIGFAG